MKKTIKYIIFFLIAFHSSAFANECILDKIKLLANYEDLKLGPAFTVFNINPDGSPHTIVGPIEALCGQNNKETGGILLQLSIIDKKVVQILFETSINNNRALFNIANKHYKAGFIKNQNKIDKKETETYTINKSDNLYFYANFKNENEFLEILEISSNKYREILGKRLLKEEERLND